MKKIRFYSVLAALALLGSLFVSCSKDDDNDLSLNDVTLHSTETYNIPLKSENWKSSDEFVASVKDNVVTGLLIGTSRISNGKKSFNVTVKPQHDLFNEPCTSWGASKSSVKSFYSSYSLQDESSTMLTFYGKKREYNQMCLFENGALKSSAAVLKASSVTAKEMVEFLGERYVYLTKSDDFYTYVSRDKKNILSMSIRSYSGLGVCYLVMFISYDVSARTRAMLSGEDLNALASMYGNFEKVSDNNILETYFESLKK